MPHKAERVLLVLTETGESRKDAESRAVVLREKTDKLIVDAYVAGANKAEIARAAGLTRQTVYGILLRAGAERAA